MAKNPIPPRPPPNVRPKNHLLRALPEAEFQRLLPDLKTISTPAKHIFHRHVLDRAGLEAAACECYAVIRGKFDAQVAKLSGSGPILGSGGGNVISPTGI